MESISTSFVQGMEPVSADNASVKTQKMDNMLVNIVKTALAAKASVKN